jgi:hypothetical protein
MLRIANLLRACGVVLSMMGVILFLWGVGFRSADALLAVFAAFLFEAVAAARDRL